MLDVISDMWGMSWRGYSHVYVCNELSYIRFNKF